MATLDVRTPVRVIRPSRGFKLPNFAELWRYRELLYVLAARDLKVRYSQTFLGVAWATVPALTYTLVFSVFVARVADIYTEGHPKWLFALTGFVLWQYFTNAVTFSANSLVSNAALITKVYFPRLLAPLAPVLSALADFVLAFGVLLTALVATGRAPALHRAWVAIPFVLLAALIAAGIGAWLAALNVRYRDVRYGIPFLMTVWMLITPLFYSAALLGGTRRAIYQINPMAGVVDGFRWSLLGGVPPSAAHIGVSVASGLVLLVTGVLYFRRMERTFADVI